MTKINSLTTEKRYHIISNNTNNDTVDDTHTLKYVKEATKQRQPTASGQGTMGQRDKGHNNQDSKNTDINKNIYHTNTLTGK